MKKAKRVLSLLMAVFTVFTTVFGHVDYTVSAAGMDKITWTKVDSFADVTTDDKVMITMTKNDTNVTYALPTTEKLGNNPAAPTVTVTDNTIVTNDGIDYGWTITPEEGVEGGYTITTGGNYLYVINNNSGMRTGTTKAVWTVDATSGYLCTYDTAATPVLRYIGIYLDKPDWRSYNNYTNNTAGQTLGIWKQTGVEAVAACEKVTASVAAGEVDTGTQVTLACATEGATIYYKLSADAEYAVYDGTPITLTENTTIYAYSAAENVENSKEVTFTYTVRTSATPLENGAQIVIYNAKNGVALTTTVASGKLKGAAVELTGEGTLQAVKTESNAALLDSIAVLDVTVDENGYYTFTNDGKYLTSGATGSSLSFADTASEYSAWKMYESSIDGAYLLKNATANYNGSPQYLEYFASTGTFTTYSLRATDDEAIYAVSFYAAPTVVTAPANPTITPESGIVDEGTTVTVTNNEEGATVYYTVDGSNPLNADNTARAEYTVDTVITITADTTVKAVAYKDGVYSEVVTNAYTLTPEEEVEGLIPNGTYVIYNPANKKLLSSKKTGYYNIGVDMDIADPTAKVIAEATELWNVTNNADGTITITGVDGVLSMDASNSSLQNNAENNKWILEQQDDGTFYVKNEGRNKYIEWYASKGNWSTYGTIYNDSIDLFKLQFVKATDGLGKVTSADMLTTGTYVLLMDNGYAPTQLNGTWVLSGQPVVEGDKVTDAAGAIWTLTVDGDNVMLTDAYKQTIAPTGGNANGIKEGAYQWKWTFNESTGTFRFAGQGADTVLLAGNVGSSSQVRAYKEATVNGSYASGYKADFTLYRVEKPKAAYPTVGSSVVIYNVAAEGVLGAQDDNTDSPSVNNVPSVSKTGTVTAGNGAVTFTVEQNGDYYRFKNETYGYLASNGTGSNAFYTLTPGEDADWTLEHLDSGFLLKSRAAQYVTSSGSKYPQYMEYYSDSYKTYSYYATNSDGTPADTSIYEFCFMPYTNTALTGGIVNVPVAVEESILPANVGVDYTFTFTVDAPFGVKELAVSLGETALTYTEAYGIYTVTVPAELITGEALTVTVTGLDTKDVAITGSFTIEVKDEPVVGNVTPASGSETGADKRPVISATIANAGEGATVTMTVNNETVEATYADGVVSYTPAADMEDGRVSVTVTVTRADGKSATKTWSFTIGEAVYQLYFGQLHSHTTYSDGSGELGSALSYIQNLPESANVDFVAFTDHSNYFDTTSAANPEGALYDMSLASTYSQETWASYKNTIADFNASQSDVVAIGGFEMTWSGGPGHMNTFNTPGIVSRNNSVLNNKTKDAGMRSYYALLSQSEGADSISQFNHPGSTFGTFADFSYWDAMIDSRIYLVEVGNGEGAVGSGGYFPSYEYYTMALDKGWHVAPTNNQDNHKGKWGNANDARDVILTDDFTEEGIYQAMRDLRMYSTEDKNLEIYYTVNDLQLGSIIAEDPEALNIKVLVNDPDASDSISKVEVIVNSGKTAYTWSDPAVIATGEFTCTLEPEYSYYYIRVTEGDGDLAVTAPVWVGEPLKLGISSVESGTSTPVTNEALTLTTTLFNSEDITATVKALTYTVNGSEVVYTDTDRYTIEASGTLPITYEYTPTVAKLTTITVTAVVEQDGVDYTFSMDITLDVQDADKLVYVGIDASHYNEYVAGNYKDSMGNFGQLAAGYSVRTVDLKTSEDLIAACSNPKYKALILTAPSRRLAAAQSDPRTYSADEIAAIKTFNENGGTVILAGWSDHYEYYPDVLASDAHKHMAATQNEVLEALGSSLRINDDATYDDSHNGGQAYRLYFNTYGESFLTEGVEVDLEHPHDRLYTEVFSHYGGASVYAVDAEGNITETLPATVSPVVYGHNSTYSVDVDKDGIGGESAPTYMYAEGDSRLLIMAMEELEGQGAIIVSGAAFMSNFEVQAEISDSGSEKNYSNYRICENLVQYINPVEISTIAEVQAQTEAGFKYTIEGIVTSNASGYDKDTAFFDCIYVQDATGGVCCFPVAGNYKIGDKVRVTGTTEFYQGEMELQVSDIKVIGEGTVTAKEVTAAQVNDGSVLGQLITVSGTVVSFEKANGLVQTIMVKDAAGNVARVFIDGYITTAEDVQNLEVGCNITVTGLASYDNTFNAPDGPFPRIRIRNRADIVCTENENPLPPTQEELVRAFVERMYTIVLGRDADPNGLNDWATGLIEWRVDGTGLVNGFVNSDEFVARNLSDEDFIKTLYLAVLNREADAAGLADWLRAFELGYTRQMLIDGFVTSAEFIVLCESYGILAEITQRHLVTSFVERMYTVALDREADAAGLEYWVTKLMVGSTDGKTVVNGFVGSPEFEARGLDDEAFIKTLYRTILGREANEADVASWIAAIELGQTRAQIMDGFIVSAEFAYLCDGYGISAILTQRDLVTNFVSRMYTVALNREADAAGLNDWVTGLLDGVIYGAQVADGFIMSAEFEARGLNDADYVKTLYMTFFNREASDADVEGWVAAMTVHGQSRRDVLRGFISAEEFRVLCEEYGIIRGELAN